MKVCDLILKAFGWLGLFMLAVTWLIFSRTILITEIILGENDAGLRQEINQVAHRFFALDKVEWPEWFVKMVEV